MEAGPGARRRPADLTVVLLGDFSVRFRGEPVEVPAGLPAQAVRFVAVHGGVVRTSRVVEALWPDASPEEGRKAVRNVLSRLRPSGVSVLEREDDCLRLPRDSRTDAHVFRAVADRVLTNVVRANAPEGARIALDHYGGDLLPADAEPWLEAPRTALRRRRVMLLDLLARDARRRGALQEAVALLELAIEAEPHDEVRRLEVADALAAAGRRGRALVHVEESRRVLRDFGLEPDAAWEAVRLRVEGATEGAVSPS